MSAPWALVCPSSRGIGFALTRHLLRTTRLPVLATTRHPEPGTTKAAILEGMESDGPAGSAGSAGSRLRVVRVDVTDEASVEAASRAARRLFPPARHHLHLGFAMPGVLTPEKSPAQVDADAGLAMLRVNVLGPLLLMKHFAEFLPRRGTRLRAPGLDADADADADAHGNGDGLAARAAWVFMSARLGSIADNRSGGWFSYRASKAAVNSVAKSLDVMLRARSGDKAVAVAYHPGTVRTGLSRDFWARVPQDRLFSPEYAAERMLSVVNGLHLGQRGKCLDWRGDEVPP
ncbi:NAD(P)-binding domain protein [Metarhizium album ARSEF 1941]|uniref:NAD(P)-binding domain protein n=1 Tax=Metarhizium album (strain ARSEF 1941) TaxID=1081103 RepID=A0A0B2WZD4_METAS|nr:NAD(P)-binding domain protein [Metarhizium album ARSEF 1941]KHN98762.1 NAD(P)-binding domain protein [Metarhizium album ARSEF 1941]